MSQRTFDKKEEETLKFSTTKPYIYFRVLHFVEKKNSKKKKNSFRLIVLEYTSFVRVSERNNNTQKTHNTQRAERERESGASRREDQFFQREEEEEEEEEEDEKDERRYTT